MSESDKGFLGRWSQRKVERAQGKVPEEASPAAPTSGLAAANPSSPDQQGVNKLAASISAEQPLPAPPALTLADAGQLTKDSDFKPFMAGNVTADVRNAAMKKLFADPQFNVMDGLDIYIDDYSLFEPIPESMLRQMVSAKFLNLFPEEEVKEGNVFAQSVPALDNAASPESRVPPDGATLAGAALVPLLPAGFGNSISPADEAQPDNHDHSDLRLQPNHAAAGPEPGCGTQ